jgi:transposase InsO family protein
MADDPVSREQLGYFRYGVIAPLLAAEPGQTLKDRIQQQADRLWVFPDGRVKPIGFGTIEKWLYGYRHGGIEALQVRRRCDAGRFRGIDEELAGRIDQVLREHPRLRTHAVIDHLASRDRLGDPPPSHSTLYRYIKAHRRPPESRPQKQERRSFEAPYAGYLWQADIMYGPHLPARLPNGRTRRQQSFLIAILDDHSRLICHAEFFFRQDLAAWLCCLETAVRKRGIPRKLYCDNGMVFTSEQLKRIAAALGMEVLHTRVRDAAAKGKIERLFQKIRRSFLEPAMELSPPGSLKQLNEAFFRWTEACYNHRVHSAFGATPIRRFMESASHLRALPEGGRRLFHVCYRRVVKKDGTFSLHGTRFETVPGLAGCKVTVSYDLRDPARVFVSWNGASYGRANLLDPKANAGRPRRRLDSEQEGDQPDA